jgi:hypothetical protein
LYAQSAQALHSRLRADLSKTNILLHGLGKFTNERQLTGYPGLAAVKTPGKIIQAHFQTAMQLGKQPALFQCRFSFYCSERSVQNQGNLRIDNHEPSLTLLCR